MLALFIIYKLGLYMLKTTNIAEIELASKIYSNVAWALHQN